MVVQYQGARARRTLGTRAAAPGHVVHMLTDEQQYSRHADAAQPCWMWCGTASESHMSPTQLALSQPGSLQVLLVCVVGCMGCAVKVRKIKLGSEKTPPEAEPLYVIVLN